MEPQAEYKKTAEKDVKKFVSQWKMPPEVELAANSLDEMMGEELGALGGALVTGVFLIFIVMAIQFESPKFSLMVMTTIPFSLIGSFGLLYLAGSPISMVSKMCIRDSCMGISLFCILLHFQNGVFCASPRSITIAVFRE